MCCQNTNYVAMFYVYKWSKYKLCRNALFPLVKVSLVQKNYDIGRMGRYTLNILQWKRNDIKAQTCPMETANISKS